MNEYPKNWLLIDEFMDFFIYTRWRRMVAHKRNLFVDKNRPINEQYSLLHVECHFFILKSLSMISFSRSLFWRSVEKRPRRLRLEIEIQWHCTCNRLYHLLHVECHSLKSSNLKFVSHMSQFVSHMIQPIACGVSFTQIRRFELIYFVYSN